MEATQQQVQPDTHTPKTIRINRRQRRYEMNHITPKYNNNRKPKGSGAHLQMMARWNDQAIHMPKRKKLKGWQKEARRRA